MVGQVLVAMIFAGAAPLLGPYFLLFGAMVYAAFRTVPLFPTTGYWSLAMAGARTIGKRGSRPGRQALDDELWETAKEAKEKADLAYNTIDKHIAVCEEQNKHVIQKLSEQDKWRKSDEKFQKWIGFGVAGAVLTALLNIVLHMLHLT